MFELSRVKIWRSIRARGFQFLVSSYREFELSGVRVIGGSSYRGFELSGGSSYRGFELSGVRVIGGSSYRGFELSGLYCINYSTSTSESDFSSTPFEGWGNDAATTVAVRLLGLHIHALQEIYKSFLYKKIRSFYIKIKTIYLNPLNIKTYRNTRKWI